MTTVPVDLSGVPSPGRSQRLRGHLALPGGDGPWPGVVVVHEGFGVDEVMLRHAERLAAAGYLTIVPDLFSDGGARRCVRQAFTDAATGTGRGVADLEAARAWLAQDPRCTGRIGIIGFCLGGQFALVAATRGSFDSAAVNYGRLPRRMDLSSSCPMVASYPGRDPSLRGASTVIQAQLARAGVPHDVLVYPAAGHSFLNDAPNGPAALRPLLRLGHVGPDPAAAAHAWQRIEAFFGTHLA